MKITLLLLIVCLTEIYASDLQIIKECFQESGEDFDLFYKGPKMTEEEILKRLTPHKAGCIELCFAKKKWGGDIPIRKRIEDELNKPHPYDTGAKIDNLRNEVDRCKKEAKDDDCDLMLCLLKPWSNEITSMINDFGFYRMEESNI